LTKTNKKKNLTKQKHKKKNPNKYIFQTLLNRPLYEADDDDCDGFPFEYARDKDGESSITIDVNN